MLTIWSVRLLLQLQLDWGVWVKGVLHSLQYPIDKGSSVAREHSEVIARLVGDLHAGQIVEFQQQRCTPEQINFFVVFLSMYKET